MTDGPDIEQVIQSHLDRAKEGRELLEQGKSLSEMKTKPIGLSGEKMKKGRQDFIDSIASFDNDRLKRAYENQVRQLNKQYEDPDKGTSEIEWRRLVIGLELEKRGLEIPKADLEKDFPGKLP